GTKGLQGPGGVFKGRLDRRLDLFRQRLLGEAVIDGRRGNSLVEVALHAAVVAALVTVLPTAAVDQEHQRRRLFRLGLPEIEDLPFMRTVFVVGRGRRHRRRRRFLFGRLL